MPTLTIDIAARLAQFQDGLDQVQRSASKTAAGMEKAFSGVKSALGAIGIGLSAAAVVDFFNKARDAAQEFEQTASRLTAVYRNIGDAAGLSRKNVEEFADGLSKTTQFDSNSLKTAATQILIFGKIHGDTFKQALQVSTDLAAFMGTSVVAAAHEVAAAMADPERAVRLLKQAGVVLTDQQKDQLKHMIAIGDTAGAQVLILGRLQGAYKGVAQEMNTGLTKATTGLSKAWNDLLEEFGKMNAVGSGGFLGIITRSLEGWAGALERINQAGGVIGRLKELMNAPGTGHALNGPQSGLIQREGTDPAAVARLQGQIDKAQISAQATAAASADQKFAQEKIATLARAQFPAIALQANKDQIAELQKLLDASHAAALTSDEDFFSKRKKLIDRSLDAEVAATEAGIRAQIDIITRTGTTPEAIASAQVEQLRLIQQKEKAQQAAFGATAILAIQSTNAEREFNKELAITASELLDIHGKTEEASALRFDAQNEERRRKLAAEALSPNAGRSAAANAGLENLKNLRSASIDQAKLNDLRAEADSINNKLANTEAEIGRQRKLGGLTDLDVEKRFSDARVRAGVELEAVKEKVEELASASSDPRIKEFAINFDTQLRSLASTADLVGERFRNMLIDPLTTFFDDVGGKTKKFGDAFKDLITGIGKQILHLQSQELAQSLVGKNGGFLALFKGMFGGGERGGGGVPLEWSGAGFAEGTDFVPKTGLAMVHQGERIIPANQNRGGGEVNINVTFGSGPPTDPQAVVRALIPVMQGIARGEIGQQFRANGVFNPA